jgi:medium-chain acyl-[acyl-carrier-protein] hydrolase
VIGTAGSGIRPTTRWVVDDEPAEDPGATQQLLCFAHAGGGPSFFRPWCTALGPEIAVRRVLLPGRDWRIEEQAFRHITELVGPLCAALEPYLDQPYALFGHSLGAVVAYEVARRFSGPSRPGPTCLIVSGRRAPGLATGRRRVSSLPDDEFLTEVGRLNGIPPGVLSEPELLEMLLPALRADYELAESYQPLPGGRLDCPVAAYMSTADPEIDYGGVLGWRATTTDQFTVRVFSGDHFYLKGGRPDVLNAVREDLLRERSAAG